ncbi:MAG: hypothetical protein ACOCWW_04315 [Bacteroidota bacterium]
MIEKILFKNIDNPEDYFVEVQEKPEMWISCADLCEPYDCHYNCFFAGKHLVRQKSYNPEDIDIISGLVYTSDDCGEFTFAHSWLKIKDEYFDPTRDLHWDKDIKRNVIKFLPLFKRNLSSPDTKAENFDAMLFRAMLGKN